VVDEFAAPDVDVQMAPDLMTPDLKVGGSMESPEWSSAGSMDSSEWSPGASAPGNRATSFPWSAIAAVAAAGLVVGITIGYEYARHTEQAAPAVAATAASAETEVAMPPESPAPAPASASAKVETTREQPKAEVPSRKIGPAPAPHATAGPGRIVIRSTPPGALVLVDGHPRGQTPATVADLALGEHAIEIARSGYVPHDERVTLSAKTPSHSLAVRLQRGLSDSSQAISNTSGSGTGGTMFVDSRPQAARVIIDGRFMGMTPLRLTGVHMGAHAVRLERTGYRAFSTTVGVKTGEQARVTAALEEH
jgi:hypothetical protein